jgi:hypothetical protein
MSKRSKKHRRAKLPVPPQAAKRKSALLAWVFVAAAMVLALSLGWWKFRSADISTGASPRAEANAGNPTTADSSSDFQRLKGRWQRPDGGYILEVKSIAPNGSMDAGYFNPRSIHVAKAEASRDGGAAKVFIELRDVNYPGSTYTLTYDTASDQLKGIYYQAVEKQRFPVAFERVK